MKSYNRTAVTTKRHPCSAWAIHHSDPPLCSAHAIGWDATLDDLAGEFDCDS
jgi:hypothetical protein